MVLIRITYLLFALILTILTYVYFTRNYNYWKKRRVPFIKPTFFFGSILEIAFGRSHPGLFIAKHYWKFTGSYFGFFAFTKPYLVITDPELIKTVLIEDFNNFSNRYFHCDEKIDPVMSNGLFAIKNPTWRWLRTKLSPFLSLNKIKHMMANIEECDRNLHNYLEDNLGKNVETKEMSARYTTDAIVKYCFGISANSFINEDGFRLAGKKMLGQSFGRSLIVFCYYYATWIVKLFKFQFIESSAVDFVRDAFENAYCQREANNGKVKNNDLIDILIDLKKQNLEFNGFTFSRENLLAQAVTFFSSGFEAAASTLAFALHELGVNQDIQEKLRNEIKTAVVTHDELTFNAIHQMKYLQMCVSETMRKYPAVSFIHRECIDTYKVPGHELTIEKGTPIIVGVYGLHYNKKYFPDPEKFDPKRFNANNIHKIINCTYLPFGDGPRSCVGQTLGLLIVKTAIIHILRNYIIEKNSFTTEPIILTPFPIIQSKGGVPLTFRRLESAF
ncbi:hypothetical protein RN001_007250 [Aquatica leii]|uniref:Cytochrome P450 n=1 Tax=Aquatica leii TaxID=1421715 RepID=A0AAN7SGR1_9COLE|nr:hypothetical protein RN001_007250 [Aquatica leii]